MPVSLLDSPPRAVTAAAGTATRLWRALRAVMGADPPDRVRQVARDALLAAVLVDRGLIGDFEAASAAADRDRTSLLFEHVLHARYGVELAPLLDALSECRAIMAPGRRLPSA